MSLSENFKLRMFVNKRLYIFFSFFLIFSLFTGCVSQKNTIQEDDFSDSETFPAKTVTEETSFVPEPELNCEPITLLFAGDIMDHKPNYNMANFNDIYADIKPLVQNADLSFANIEAPVDDSRPFSTYPTFNMKNIYVQAAIDAGFNVFSLANNHTNDQGLEGIFATCDFFAAKELSTLFSERPVYACGIKKEKNTPPYTYRIINVKGWKILFLAVTEILNRPDHSSYIDFYNPTEEQRTEFINYIVNLRNKNPCDLFVLSLHCCEPEYIRTVNKKQNVFYRQLLDNGVDIVWANHPHVAKDWEIFGNKETGIKNKIIFNAMGNTISGQRWDPQFKKPETERDYTGDGYIIKITLDKKDGIKITDIEPHLITTYITPEWTYVIKELDEDFIDELKEKKQTSWAEYLTERKKLMEKVKGIETWQ